LVSTGAGASTATSLETCDLDPRCWLAMAIDGEMVEINGKIHGRTVGKQLDNHMKP
jgi:hypothetical protein